MKCIYPCAIMDVGGVTPCVGVWIEIDLIESLSSARKVTPCVGVWIEITSYTDTGHVEICHSLRGSVD